MRTQTKISVVTASLAVASAVTVAPSVAQAKKPGVLEKKPIVENKIELRKLRFQLTPRIGTTLSQPYVHKGLVGGELRFDFLDFLGVRATGAYGLISVDSAVLKDLNGGALPEAETAAEDGGGCLAGLPCRPAAEAFNPAALKSDFRAGLTDLKWQASADLMFTPLAGKLGMFSAIFTEYDLYVFGGLGITGWGNTYDPDKNPTTSEIYGIENSTDPNGVDAMGNPNYCEISDGTVNRDCQLHPVKADTGIRLGPSFGAGLHLFVSDWGAVNIEVQDIMVQQNITGLNATVEDPLPIVDNDDRVWTHNVATTLGFTLYFPFKAKRTRVGRPTTSTPLGVAASTDNADPTMAPLTEEAPLGEEPVGEEVEEIEEIEDEEEELELE